MNKNPKNNGKNKSLKNIRDKAKKEYVKVKSIYCPYFEDEIIFNAKGFNHLRYRGSRKERHWKVQEMRYKLFMFAPKILKISTTVQEYHKEEQFFIVKHNEKSVQEKKLVKYYAFIAIVGDNLSEAWKTKVIVRKVGNGKMHFWSIVPNWKTRKSKESRKNFINYTGILSKD